MYQNVFTPLQHMLRPPVRTGGLCWVVFARKADVDKWPEMHPSTNLAFTPISLKSGKTWYQLNVIDKDRLFSETAKDSNAGPYWDMQLAGYFGSNNAAHTLTAGLLVMDEFVVMFQDRDGLIRFIGNEDAGATCRPAYNSGDRDSSRKRTLQFAWEHPNPAPIYIGSLDDIADDIIVPPFAGQGDFSNDFGSDFDNG